MSLFDLDPLPESASTPPPKPATLPGGAYDAKTFMQLFNKECNPMGYHPAYMNRYGKTRTYGLIRTLYTRFVIKGDWTALTYVRVLEHAMAKNIPLSIATLTRIHDKHPELTEQPASTSNHTPETPKL